jgi:serine/threonine protein kinase/Tol biopolymer transport system component
MALAPGTRLGPYEILALIGAGGMGEVYRAKDTKLKREVALKVLPEAFAADPERMARFQREAEVLASLNHPNIAQIYGVEDRALVMELVEGESPKGPIPFDDAWKIGLQMADALEYAHERGVIHRDLKPANVKVTPDGVVKLLDFGLAEAFAPEDAPSANPDNSPTLTMGATHLGVILGTVGYMAPEQAKGKKVDKRADIWSWGVVLYELLKGERIFQGEDAAETLAAVIHNQPDLSGVPTKVRRLLGECLQKDPKLRLRDIGDARRLLEEPVVTRSRSRLGIVIAAAVFSAIALGFGWWHSTRTLDRPGITKLSILPPEGATFDRELPAVSPDGRHVAFQALTAGQTQLWVRDLDSLTSRPLPGTEGGVRPFWSPDSRNIGFFAGGKLKRVALSGGPVLSLAESPHTYFGAWNRDEVILYTPNDAIFRVSGSGGTPTQVTEFDSKTEGFHAVDGFLPDGHHFLFNIIDQHATTRGTFLGDLDSKERRPIRGLESAFPLVVYAPPGYVLFGINRTNRLPSELVAQLFDTSKGELKGGPVPLGETTDAPSYKPGYWSVSQNGVLVYFPNGAARELTWFDRSGRAQGSLGPQGLIPKGVISPDGKTVAFTKSDAMPVTIWLHDVEHGTDTLFEQNAQTPVWSPNGGYVAFSKSGALYRKAVNGPAKEQLLDGSNPQANRFSFDWSSDSRYLLEEIGPNLKSGRDIWVMPLFGDRKPYPLFHSEFNEREPKLSPDMHWLAYTSDESGRDEVYVVSFPNPGRTRKISTDGGSRAVWSRDGKDLYFIGPGGEMMAAEIKPGSDFDYSVPKPLFDTPIGQASFDVAKNGRFLIAVGAAKGATNAIQVVINWPAELKK